MYLKRLFDGQGQIRGVKIVRGRTRQRFTPRFLHKGLTEGWLTLTGDTFVLSGDTPTVYRIVREPGRYPDPNIHSGYRLDRFYECERLTAAQTTSSRFVSRAAFLPGTTLVPSVGTTTTTMLTPTWNAGTTALMSPAIGRN